MYSSVPTSAVSKLNDWNDDKQAEICRLLQDTLRTAATSCINRSLQYEVDAQLKCSTPESLLASYSTVLKSYDNDFTSTNKLIPPGTILVPGAAAAIQHFLIAFAIPWLLNRVLHRKRCVRRAEGPLEKPRFALILALQQAALPQPAYQVGLCTQVPKQVLAGGYGQSSNITPHLGHFAGDDRGQQLQQYNGGSQGLGGDYHGGASDVLNDRMPEKSLQVKQEDPHEHLDCLFRAHPDPRIRCTRFHPKHFEGFRSIADLQGHLNKQHGILYCTSCLNVELNSAAAWRKHNEPERCQCARGRFPEKFKSDWPGWSESYPTYQQMKEWTDLINGNALNQSVEERWRAMFTVLFGAQFAHEVRFRYEPPPPTPRVRQFRASSEIIVPTPLRHHMNNKSQLASSNHRNTMPLPGSTAGQMWQPQDLDLRSIASDSDQSTIFSRPSQMTAPSTQPSSLPMHGAHSLPGYMPPFTFIPESPWQTRGHDAMEQLAISALDQGISSDGSDTTLQAPSVTVNNSGPAQDSFMPDFTPDFNPYCWPGLDTDVQQPHTTNLAQSQVPTDTYSNAIPPNDALASSSAPPLDPHAPASQAPLYVFGEVLRDVVRFSDDLRTNFELGQYPNRDSVPVTPLTYRERELVQAAASFLNHITTPERIRVLRQLLNMPPPGV